MHLYYIDCQILGKALGQKRSKLSLFIFSKSLETAKFTSEALWQVPNVSFYKTKATKILAGPAFVVPQLFG